MKNKLRYVVLLIFCLSLAIILCACDNIKINGDFEETIEVNTEYVDPGIACANKYKVVTESELKTNTVGKYQILYKVFTNNGELVKELYRYVNVVDTTAPTYKQKTDKTYYVGISYGINDFISYSDNCDDVETITTNSNSFIFKKPGQNTVVITLTDSSNNTTTFSKTINAVLDLDITVKYVYRDQPNLLSTNTGVGTDTGTRVELGSGSFTYYRSGIIEYTKNVSSTLGSTATMRILAVKIDGFNQASIAYQVSNYVGPSLGSATFDATKKYNNLTVSSFELLANDGHVNESVMLSEYNNQLLPFLNEFQDYMSGTLNINITNS